VEEGKIAGPDGEAAFIDFFAFVKEDYYGELRLNTNYLWTSRIR
jgi:hypothetical protein